MKITINHYYRYHHHPSHHFSRFSLFSFLLIFVSTSTTLVLSNPVNPKVSFDSSSSTFQTTTTSVTQPSSFQQSPSSTSSATTSSTHKGLRHMYDYFQYLYDIVEILTDDNPTNLEHDDKNQNDHELPRDKRYDEFCGTKSPTSRSSFVTSQNVGLIEFRIPVKTQGFRVSVKFRDNPYPCNVMLQVPSWFVHNTLYTLRNHGRQVNCTASVLFPSSVTLLNMDIGDHDQLLGEFVKTPLPSSSSSSSSESTNHTMTTSTITEQPSEASLRIKKKCKENGCQDYFEVRVGDDLDPLLMSPVANFCGTFSSAMSTISAASATTNNATRVDVECGNTAVRLVSSGKRENYVTLFLDLFVDVDSKPCPRRARRHSSSSAYNYHV